MVGENNPSENSLSEKARNPQEMVARVRVYGRHLLYYPSPVPHMEADGYKSLANLRDSQGTHRDVREAVEKEVAKRWGKIGFYEKRGSQHAEAYSFQDKLQVGLLGLASVEQALTYDQFAAKIRSRLPHAKPDEILSKLEELFVLDFKLGYVPLIRKRGKKIEIQKEARQEITPHLPVLTALAYPEIIPEKDVERSIQLDAEFDAGFNKLAYGLESQDLWGLEFFHDQKDPIDVIEGIQRRLEGEEEERALFRKVDFMISDTNLAELTFVSGYANKLDISIWDQPSYAHEYLTRDFSGKLVRGQRTVASISMDKFIGRSHLELEGSFMPPLPLDLAKANGVHVSDSIMNFNWNLQEPEGRKIDLHIGYCGSFQDPLIGSSSSYVSDEIGQIEISRARNERAPGGFDNREVEIAGNVGKTHMRFPNGDAYEVSYVRDEDVVTVTIAKGDWIESIQVPARFDPVALQKLGIKKIEELLASIGKNAESIKVQLDRIKDLSLTEDVKVREQEAVATGNELKIYAKKFRELPEQARFEHIGQTEEALAKIADPKSNFAAKAYILVLLRQEKSYSEEIVTDSFRRPSYLNPLEENIVVETKRKMRTLIAQKQLAIPESFLLLTEQAFLE